MKIGKSLILLFLVAFCLILKADASKLPDDVWKYIKSNLPEAKQRFDSVITLRNGVMYIPLYPPADTEVEKIDIEYSYPSVMSLKQQPEVVLLNNGFSLLKVFKDKEGNYTLTSKDDLPIKVRLGLMPQDMLTPVGLKMPESLKLTLGDLLIPSKDESALTRLDETQKSPYAPVIKRNEFVPSAEFNNKTTFINPKNSKFLEVYDNTSPNPLYELKLSAMPKKIITDATGENALVLYWNIKNLDIISLKDENIIAKIVIDDVADDVALNKKDNIAYVTSSKGQEIYYINLNSMQLKKVVKLDQKPTKITYCDTDNSISFLDGYSGNVYNLSYNGTDYVSQNVGEVKNLSAIIADVANIYGISRTESTISVIDKNVGKLVSTIELDKKPTDALMYGSKIFILCSKEGYIDVYDIAQNKIVSKSLLDKEEFYSKMTLIPNEKQIIVTGLNAKNYMIYNLETLKPVKKQDSYINVSNIIIMNKNQSL